MMPIVNWFVLPQFLDCKTEYNRESQFSVRAAYFVSRYVLLERKSFVGWSRAYLYYWT